MASLRRAEVKEDGRLWIERGGGGFYFPAQELHFEVPVAARLRVKAGQVESAVEHPAPFVPAVTISPAHRYSGAFGVILHCVCPALHELNVREARKLLAGTAVEVDTTDHFVVIWSQAQRLLFAAGGDEQFVPRAASYLVKERGGLRPERPGAVVAHQGGLFDYQNRAVT